MAKKLDVSISILGSQWRVVICSETDDERLQTCTGFTDWTAKTICIVNWSEQESSLSNPSEYAMKALRHEIIHAFMFESGLADDWQHQSYGHDETTIDWFAYQLPKITDAIQKIEAKLGVKHHEG